MFRERIGAMSNTPFGWVVDHPVTDEAYERVVVKEVHPNQARPKDNVGSRTGWCRMCKSPGLTQSHFRKEAHIIPQAFGNRALVSLEECDECNEVIGSVLEGDLVTYLGLTRVFTSRPSGPTRPKVKVRQQGGHVVREAGPHYKVQLQDDDDSVQFDLDDASKEGRLLVSIPPHRPMNVARSIVRMGVLAAPSGFLSQMEPLRCWLRGHGAISCVVTRMSTGPLEWNRLIVDVFRRRGPTAAVWAPWVFLFSFSRVTIAVHPLLGADFRSMLFPVPPFASNPSFERSPPRFSQIVVEDENMVRGAKEEITLTFEARRSKTSEGGDP